MALESSCSRFRKQESDGDLLFYREVPDERGEGVGIPADTTPAHIIIDGLEIRSGRPPYGFTDDAGGTQDHSSNAAAILSRKAISLRFETAQGMIAGTAYLSPQVGPMFSW